MKKLLFVVAILAMASLCSTESLAQTMGQENTASWIGPNGLILTTNLNYGGISVSQGPMPGAPPVGDGNVSYSNGLYTITFPSGGSITTDATGHYVAGSNTGSCNGCPPPPPPPPPPPTPTYSGSVEPPPPVPFYYYTYYYDYYYLNGSYYNPPPPNPPTPPPPPPPMFKDETIDPCKDDATLGGVSTYVTPDGQLMTLPPGSKVHSVKGWDYDYYPNGSLYLFTLPDGRMYGPYVTQFAANGGTVVPPPEFYGYYRIDASGHMNLNDPYNTASNWNNPAANPDGSYNVVKMEKIKTSAGCKIVKKLVSYTPDSYSSNSRSMNDDISYASQVPGSPVCEDSQTIPCDPSANNNNPNPPPPPTLDTYIQTQANKTVDFLRNNTQNSVKIYLSDCGTGLVKYTMTAGGGLTPITTTSEGATLAGKFSSGNFTSTDEDIAIKGCVGSDGKWNYEVKFNYSKLNADPRIAPVLNQVIEEIKKQTDDEVAAIKKVGTQNSSPAIPVGGGEEFRKKDMDLIQTLTAFYDFGKELITKGQMPEKVWDRGVRSGPSDPQANAAYNKSPLHVPSLLGGVDQLVDEVTGPLQLVSTAYRFVKNPRQSFEGVWNGVRNLNFNKIKQIAKGATGVTNYQQGGDRARYQGSRHAVQAAMIVFSAVKTLTKGPSVVNDAGKELSDAQKFVNGDVSDDVSAAIKNAVDQNKLLTPIGADKMITKNVENGQEILVIIEKRENGSDVFPVHQVNNIDVIPENVKLKAGADDLVAMAEDGDFYNYVQNNQSLFVQGKQFEISVNTQAKYNPAFKEAIAQKSGLTNLDGFTGIEQLQVKLPGGGYMVADNAWFKPIPGQPNHFEVILSETKLTNNSPFTGRQNQLKGDLSAGTTTFDCRSVRFQNQGLPKDAVLHVKSFVRVNGNGTGNPTPSVLDFQKIF